MTETVTKGNVRGALTRIQEALTLAAGVDKRLSKADVERCLDALAPTERAAVDAFVGVLRDEQKQRGGLLTVGDIERTVTAWKEKLTGPELGGPPSVEQIPAAELQALPRIGDALVRLAARLGGEQAAVLPPVPTAELAGKSGAELLAAIREHCAPHLRLDYGTARDIMYSRIDVKDGVVRDVYADRAAPAMSRGELERQQHINTEHTRPRSTGVDHTPALSDLHHLFPTDAEANGKRSSLPFGVVANVVWQKGESKLGTDAAGDTVFEPPDAHKGEVARALFYIAAVYGLEVPGPEETVLRAWHKLDPASDAERARNDAISRVQENRNPFVDDPGLIDRIDDI